MIFLYDCHSFIIDPSNNRWFNEIPPNCPVAPQVGFTLASVGQLCSLLQPLFCGLSRLGDSVPRPTASILGEIQPTNRSGRCEALSTNQCGVLLVDGFMMFPVHVYMTFQCLKSGWDDPKLLLLDCSGGSGSAKNIQEPGLILVFLWIYFFHIALYHTTIALTVSNSYFQGDLAEHHLCPSVGGCFGAPMVVSLGNIFRYHLGSLAFRSFALMLCTVARVVFEYVERHTKERVERWRVSASAENGLGWSWVCCQGNAVTAKRTPLWYPMVAICGNVSVSISCPRISGNLGHGCSRRRRTKTSWPKPFDASRSAASTCSTDVCATSPSRWDDDWDAIHRCIVHIHSI